VSSLTKNPISFTLLAKLYRSHCKVGSHPQILTQSNLFFLVSKKLKKASSGIKSFFIFAISFGRTDSGL
jgi:hypothetical protein